MAHIFTVTIEDLNNCLPEGNVFAEGAKIMLPDGNIITYHSPKYKKELQDLKNQFAILTYRLKHMEDINPDYAQVWDKRVDVRVSIMQLESQIKQYSK